MKITSVVIFLFLLSFDGRAQNDSSLPAKKQLKKGFYKNYQEYLDNNPSITHDFRTELFRANKRDTTVIAGAYTLNDQRIKLKKIWGFCDGESVFIRYKVLIGNTFYKAQVLGPHPYFLYKEKMILLAGPPVMALATAAATAALPADFEIMAVIGPGRPKYVWMGTMKKILKDQPELLAAFKKEVKVISNRSRAKYLKLYSEAAAQ